MSFSGTVNAIGSAASAVGAGIAADLEQAAEAARMGGQFHCDPEVLYGYYNRLSTLYSKIDEALTELKATGPQPLTQCGGRIAGAAAAAEATNLATGELGLRGALQAIQQSIASHLSALRDNYLAYLENERNIVTTMNSVDTRQGDARPSGW